MPRVARTKSNTGIYHIMLRGINRQTIFEDNEDKIRFLQTLVKYKSICGYKIYSYCLMDNHIHLLLEESEEPISNVTKRISSSYVYWYNMKYNRCGHLFQDRFKSENVENVGYFLTVLRYIHQNPLKAGLVKNIFESNWTSVHEYIGEAKIVDTNFALNLFSSNKKRAIYFFTEFMHEHNEDKCLDMNIVIRITDQEVIEYLNSMGYSITSLQQLERKNRDALLAELKQLNGVSIRQLSRITGISKSVIQRL